MMPIHKSSTSVLLLVFLGMVVLMLPVDGRNDEELDPYDMVNFDHVKMKMKKSTPPVLKSIPPDSEPQQEPPANEPTGESDEAQDEDTAKSVPPDGENQAPTAHECPQQQQQQEASQSCPALSLFQQFVSRLLLFVQDKVSQLDEQTPTKLCVYFSLTSYQVQMMESFKRDHSKDRVFSAHDVLTQAIQGARVLDSSDPNFGIMWLEQILGVTVEKAVQVLFFVVLLVALTWRLSKLHFSKNLVIWLFFLAFLLSVATTWYRLYKGEVAKQHEAMMKDQPSGCGKVPDGVLSFYKYYFTFQRDECIAYYEHLLVNPLVKVSVMEALAVAVVQTLLKPMRTVGMETSEFIRALVKDLPVQWQMVSVVIVFSLITLVLFLSCGYSIRIPFLLAIEPSRHSDKGGDVKALEKKVDELQAAVESIGASGDTHHPLALPKPTPTVAAHPPSVSCSCRQAADGGEDTQVKKFRCPAESPSADDTPRKEPKSGKDLHRGGDIKALETRLSKLQAVVESIGASEDTQYPPALPQPTPPGDSGSCGQAAEGGEDAQASSSISESR